MNQSDEALYNEIWEITPREFRFIRQIAGFSMRELSKLIGNYCESTISRWEQQRCLMPYQIKLLWEVIPKDLWIECRKRYAIRFKK
jgi:DNA-binding transcriptional regulator YiaG